MISVNIHTKSSFGGITLQLEDKVSPKLEEVYFAECGIFAEVEDNSVTFRIICLDADYYEVDECVVQGTEIDSEASINALSKMLLDFDGDSARRIIADILRNRSFR